MQYNIITTINTPTDAVRKFSVLPMTKTIVVGDVKTPSGWNCKNTEYIGVDSLFCKKLCIHKTTPVNHYSRKNIGYLYAIKAGATSILDSDDDNIPKDDYSFPPFEGCFNVKQSIDEYVNIYQHFTDKNEKIWPRGFPLEKINSIEDFDTLDKRKIVIGVWQGLVDNEPDVDAIYRLTNNKSIIFLPNDPLVLDKNTYAPFNSQNTLFSQEAFPLLYLPSTVSFRFTDILRGIIAQEILWCYNLHLGFTSANIIQNRNEHNLMKDFESELSVYKYIGSIEPAIKESIRSNENMCANLFNVYHKLVSLSVVQKDELLNLENWIKDIS